MTWITVLVNWCYINKTELIKLKWFLYCFDICTRFPEIPRLNFSLATFFLFHWRTKTFTQQVFAEGIRVLLVRNILVLSHCYNNELIIEQDTLTHTFGGESLTELPAQLVSLVSCGLHSACPHLWGWEITCWNIWLRTAIWAIYILEWDMTRRSVYWNSVKPFSRKLSVITRTDSGCFVTWKCRWLQLSPNPHFKKKNQMTINNLEKWL